MQNGIGHIQEEKQQTEYSRSGVIKEDYWLLLQGLPFSTLIIRLAVFRLVCSAVRLLMIPILLCPIGNVLSFMLAKSMSTAHAL